MILPKFSKQLNKIANIEDSLMQHLQGLTDNLYQALTRGLSYDKNLNSKIVKVSVVSGRAFSLNSTELASISGAIIVNTNGAKVKQFSYKTTPRGDLEAVLELDTNSTVTFLLIGG